MWNDGIMQILGRPHNMGRHPMPALGYDGRRRVHHADDMMARTAAQRRAARASSPSSASAKPSTESPDRRHAGPPATGLSGINGLFLVTIHAGGVQGGGTGSGRTATGT